MQIIYSIISHSKSFLVKENSMKGNIHFFLFRCYGNQASLKFVKKKVENLMDTNFEALYKRYMSYYFNIYIYEKK